MPEIDDARYVWRGLLDDRFQVDVIRDVEGPAGKLLIFDTGDGDREIHSESVAFLYGAQFGPDVSDVADWQDRAIKAVEKHGETNA